MSNKKAIQNKIDEAIFDFTIGENEKAKIKLSNITEKNPENAAAWHALAEILLSEKNYEKALNYGEKAYTYSPKDLHINTTLSRIWVQLNNQKKAEYYNAQARMLGWKEQLKTEKFSDNT